MRICAPPLRTLQWRIGLILGLGALLGPGSLAGAIRSDKTGGMPIQIEIGPEIYEEHYQESIGGRKFMMEEAPMRGVSGKISIHTQSVARKKNDAAPSVTQIVPWLAGRVAQGKTRYTGAYQGKPYGSLVTDGHARWVSDLRTGILLKFKDFSMLNFGLGKRTLTDHLEEAGPGGYKRVSEYTYLLLGAEDILDLGALAIRPSFSYLTLVTGKQHSYLPPGSGNYDCQNTQSGGRGLEVSVGVYWQASDTVGIALTPYARTWQIPKSDINTICGVFEPENDTKELGTSLTVFF